MKRTGRWEIGQWDPLESQESKRWWASTEEQWAFTNAIRECPAGCMNHLKTPQVPWLVCIGHECSKCGTKVPASQVGAVEVLAEMTKPEPQLSATKEVTIYTAEWWEKYTGRKTPKRNS